jgi:hypothetical protein
MITPGLYRHYKGKSYRVLFVAPWWSGLDDTLQPDQLIHVTSNEYAAGEGLDGVGLVTSATELSFLTVKWSGNNGTVRLEECVVIYVALYAAGRVAARTVAEFEEGIKETGGRRFERIGD